MSGTAVGRIHIGTSGWHYAHWVGPFYPTGMRPDAFLGFYADRFGSVEINRTFYRLPTPAALAAWRQGTPPGFVFACKASRFITHMKKLRDPEQMTRFFDAVALLGDKLGPILFQLPPRWGVDADRLAAFLDRVPRGFRYAFEFRDESWFTPPVLRLLERHGAALCAYDFDGRRSPVRLTARFAYVRLHGPGDRYRGSYDDAALSRWARRLSAWAAAGVDAYCYFDNDEAGHAAADAARLAAMIAGRCG
jgi:uncharacterized protein YecE (DUF72 family)